MWSGNAIHVKSGKLYVTHTYTCIQNIYNRTERKTCQVAGMAVNVAKNVFVHNKKAQQQ